jgi:DNA-binding transcriptional LysR family regulator
VSQIRDLHVFVAVAESGSFSAAARSLRLSPSTVSKLIARIENRVGVRIFDRSLKSAILTREGEIYLQNVRRAIDAMAELESLGETLARVPHGTLRVHAGPSFTRSQIAPLLPEFAARYPDLRIEFRLGPRFVGLADDMDIAIHFGTLADSSLVLRRIATSRRILCAAPSYLGRRGVPKTPRDLMAHQLLNYTMPGRETWPFFRGQKVEHVPIQSQICADQADLLLELVRQGMGIVRLPEFDVADDFAAGRLVPVLAGYARREAIYAVVRARRNLSPRLRVFIDFVEQRLRDKAWNVEPR